MNSIIRLMTKEDIDEVVGIFESILFSYRSYISHGEIQMGIAFNKKQLNPNRKSIWRKYILDCIETYSKGVFVASNQNRVVGFLITKIDQDNYKPYATINDICVLPDYREQGLGSKLLQNALVQIRADGIKKVFFESGIDNTYVHKRVKKFGFNAVSIIFMANVSEIAIDVNDD